MAAEKKTILVAVDKSVCSDNALNYYLTSLHRPAEHRVVLVHAAEVPRIVTPFHGVSIDEAENTHSMWIEATEKREAELKELHKHLEKLMEDCGHEVDHEILITQYHHGHLGEAIVQQADDRSASLIVTGSRGLGTLRRTILGSVSDYILHHAKCPVIICHFDHDKYHHVNEAKASH